MNKLDLGFAEPRMVLIDGHAIIHRAFHALPPLTNKRGEPVGAVYGFLRVIFKIIREQNPAYLTVAFDHPGPTFRHKIFGEYKATRVKAPDELYRQIPVIKEIMNQMGISTIEQEGFEADDLIGSLAKQVDRSVKKIVVTGDADLLQLADQQTEIILLQRGLQHQSFGPLDIKKRYQGLGPEQLIELKGLKGDSSDNIPGVPGVGEKTGLNLIQRFNNLEGAYEHLEELPLKLKEKLEKFREQAFTSREIGRIRTDLPIERSLEKYRQKSYNKKTVEGLLDQIGIKSLIKDLP